MHTHGVASDIPLKTGDSEFDFLSDQNENISLDLTLSILNNTLLKNVMLYL